MDFATCRRMGVESTGNSYAGLANSVLIASRRDWEIDRGFMIESAGWFFWNHPADRKDDYSLGLLAA